MIQQVSIIGSGNVATQMAKALFDHGIQITHVVSRTKENAMHLAKAVNAKVSEINNLPNQLTIICISDDAIAHVLSQISEDIPVVYTSGSVGLDELPKRQKLGVLYPLQTMSKTGVVEMRNVPFLVESENEDFQETIQKFAQQLSTSVHTVNSEQRRKIHMAAVWINNFTNHIVYQAQKITKEQDLDYQLLLPLLKETLSKLDTKSAFEAQTGPARRGDSKTIDKHLKAQTGTAKELYQLLTDSIKETYKNEKL
ncbi:MAG: DUF2520 domain-containing protein [bacterium]|nr:DUF2520 domain-containing protein [bacterium]